MSWHFRDPVHGIRLAGIVLVGCCAIRCLP
jgi:hypothetical protein